MAALRVNRMKISCAQVQKQFYIIALVHIYTQKILRSKLVYEYMYIQSTLDITYTMCSFSHATCTYSTYTCTL